MVSLPTTASLFDGWGVARAWAKKRRRKWPKCFQVPRVGQWLGSPESCSIQLKCRAEHLRKQWAVPQRHLGIVNLHQFTPSAMWLDPRDEQHERHRYDMGLQCLYALAMRVANQISAHHPLSYQHVSNSWPGRGSARSSRTRRPKRCQQRSPARCSPGRCQSWWRHMA